MKCLRGARFQAGTGRSKRRPARSWRILSRPVPADLEDLSGHDQRGVRLRPGGQGAAGRRPDRDGSRRSNSQHRRYATDFADDQWKPVAESERTDDLSHLQCTDLRRFRNSATESLARFLHSFLSPWLPPVCPHGSVPMARRHGICTGHHRARNIYACPLKPKLRPRRRFVRRAATPSPAKAGSRKLPCACS